MLSLPQLEHIVASLDPKGPPTARWIVRAEENPQRLGVLSASFNPLTRAHVAILERAERQYALDGVLLLLAKANVDKPVFGASLAHRLDMLQRYCRKRPSWSVAVVSHGRFVDKIQALRAGYPPETAIFFLVGYDTLVRLFDPRYYRDRDRELETLFRQCTFIAANRGKEGIEAIERFMRRPENVRYASHVYPLEIAHRDAQISSTQVRERLARGEDVASLVPPEILDYLRQHRGLYA